MDEPHYIDDPDAGDPVDREKLLESMEWFAGWLRRNPDLAYRMMVWGVISRAEEDDDG
jgi:hypothetical protein